MPLTPAHLAQVNSFDSLAELFHDELRWPKPTWSSFAGVAELYDIPAKDLPGVQSLHAVQRLDETQQWGIFLADFGPNELRRSQLRQILNRVAERAKQRHDNPTWPHENILFICRSQSTTWTLGHYTGDKPANAKLQTFGWSDPNEARTAIENIQKLAWGRQKDWSDAWNVERLSDTFFSELSQRFHETEDLWPPTVKAGDRRATTQYLFNRLLFICFLQQKGWLEWNGVRPDYLFRLYDDTNTSDPEGDTFSRRLELLFFSGLSTPNSLPGAREDLEPHIGRVPFLNGGLFERSSLDIAYLPNRAYRPILGSGGLLRSYNFTIEEATPLDVDVAIDPEMLGKVFEELVTQRHDTGSYYTPRPIVSFMCREALKGYLGGYEHLVDDHDASGIEINTARTLVKKLENVKFCDPACGSGAYLVGMLQEVFAILRLLDTRTEFARTDYQRKRIIIEKCLYGVDYEPFAVTIAWLRLWLALVIEHDANPLDDPTADVALPNLDLKIESGDSVAGSNPQEAILQTVSKKEIQGGFDFEGVDTLVKQYIDRRKEYQLAHGPLKTSLSAQIKNLREQIKLRVNSVGISPRAFLWPIEFPELFLSDDPGFVKGFDIILANPPYVRQEKIKETMGEDYKKKLPANYPDSGSGTADLFIYFYDRGLQLLKPGGMFVYISSNKWFKASYGGKLRGHFARNATIHSITDFGDLPVFKSALAYAMIFIASKDKPIHDQAPIFTAVKSLGAPYPDVKAVIKANGFALPPDAIQGENWTLADEETLRKLRIMRKRGTPLGEYVKGQIYRGVLTGFNEAFVIDGATRARLIAEDPRSAEIIKPYLQGNEISKWTTTTKGDWLLFMRWDVDISQYPAIGNHLRRFESSLVKRPEVRDGRYKWYCLGRYGSTYWPTFADPKIVYQVLQVKPAFTLDTSGAVPNNAVWMLPGADLFLLGYLNSACCWAEIKRLCTPIQNGFQLIADYFREILVPKASSSDRETIGTLVLNILNAKAVDSIADISALEAEIDARVNFLYFHQTGDETYDQWQARLAAEAGTEVGHLRTLIHSGESATLEFKQSLEAVDESHPAIVNTPEAQRPAKTVESRRAVLHSALKSICAFRNANGGTLLLGVHDTGETTGLAPDYALLSRRANRDGFELKLFNLIKTRLSPIPFDLQVRFISIDGVDVCQITIPPGPPTYLDNALYVRLGNSTEQLAGRQLEDWLTHRSSAA